jgi:predicted MFS family arabinose efflux permease
MTTAGALRSQAYGIAMMYAETDLTPLLLVGVLFGAGQFTLAAYAVLYLTEQMSLAPTIAGGLYIVMQLAGVGSRILFGYVADRWLLRNRHWLLFAIGIVGFPAYLVLAWLPANAPLTVVGIAVTLIGALCFEYNGIYLTIANELVGREHTGFSKYRYCGRDGRCTRHAACVWATGRYHRRVRRTDGANRGNNAARRNSL